MNAPRWLSWVLVLLAGAGLGTRAAVGVGQARAGEAPPGWERTELEVPFRRPDLTGALGIRPDAYFLDHFEGLVAPVPSGRLHLDLTLPVGASATLSLGAVALGLRVSEGELAVEGLSCEERIPLSPGRHELTVETDEGLVVRLGEERLACSGRLPDGAARLASGLRRIHVHAFEGEGFSLPPPLGLAGIALAGLLGAAAAAALVALEVATGASLAAATLTSLPWLLSWLVLSRDGYRIVEEVRLAGWAPEHLPAVVLGLSGLAPKVLHAAGRLARTRLHLLAPLLPAVALVLCALPARPGWPLALVYGAGAAALVGLVIWANVRTVRGFNLISLAAVAGALALSEQAVRFTGTGISWSRSGGLDADPVLGWTRNAAAEFDALEAGEYTDYPIEGYPTAPGRLGSRPRLVAFGGSSTGGAFQNDDLDEFYPARLQERLGERIEVVNQGVGGWSTFHIAEYARRRLAELRPSLVTLYVGHNDGYTRVPRPYRELYAAWREGEGATTPRGPDLRLLNGLSFLVRALRPREMGVAVPVDYARDNLETVADVARAAGAKVLIASEGIHPDPGALAEYWAMMEAFAATREDLAWLDTATMLREAGDRMFLDDCHLSEAGHAFVAEAFHARLEELGWLEGAP